jgi:hypothetical protein
VGSRDPELRNSPDAFIFSMTNHVDKPPCRMFPTKDPRSACSSNSSYGPVWGNGYDLVPHTLTRTRMHAQPHTQRVRKDTR